MRNGDPNFDKLLLSLNLINTNNMVHDKKVLFYSVCIVARFVLYSLILLLAVKKFKYLPYLVLLFALASVINLSVSIYDGNNNQWWSKWFQLIVAVVLIIYCGLMIGGAVGNYYVLPMVLYVSLFGGIVQSLIAMQ